MRVQSREMDELRAGLYWWSAPHPEWTPTSGGPDGWPQLVTSYALDTGDVVVAIDPIAPPPELLELAAGRESVVVLTCPWHERDAAELVAQLGAPVHGPSPEEGRDRLIGPVFGAGGKLPGEIVVQPAVEENDLVLWIPAHRALVFGDVLIDRGNGLEIPATWSPVDVSRAERVALLEPLLDLPVELVLPTHGPPTDRAALERALAS
jgi:glyoxylase-like metal-dependent hydrolase (beta-lactamase superfamily II)